MGFMDNLYSTLGLMNGEQVYTNFKEGRGSRQLQQATQQLDTLTRRYLERVASLKQASDLMQEAFTGEVGDAAAAGAGPVVLALEDSARSMAMTQQTFDAQAQTWHDADNTVVPVPPAPEKPSGFSQTFKRVTFRGGEADAADASYEAGVAARDAANQQNVDTFSRYSAGTSNVTAAMPDDYPDVNYSGAGVEVSDPKGSRKDGRTTDTPDVGATSASSVYAPSGSAGSSYGGAPNVGGTGGLTGGGGGLQPGMQTGAGGVNTNPAGGIGTGPGGGGGRPIGGGPIIGGPIGGPIAAGSGDNTRRGPRSGGAMRPGGPGAGKPGGSSAAGRLTGAGAPKGPGGAGAGTPKGGAVAGAGGPKAGGGPLAGGKGAGVGGPGGGAAGAAQAAKAAGAGGGRGGMAGMAGGGAGRGGKDEDKEHKRADFLQENDPEGLFGTDEKTAPPVIGDPTFDPSKDPRAGR